MSQRTVRGDDLLYRFLTELLHEDHDRGVAMAMRIIESMAIWLPLDVYYAWPVLLPFVVRDPACRGNRAKGVADAWSAPDAGGYLRDDNSLVKTLPRSLSVRGPAGSPVHGARMGTEFVASHIWRKVKHEHLASRVPLLNTFVPNLVWLPRQIAKLSDRESETVQRTLQAVSRSVYERAPVAPHLEGVVQEAWDLLPSDTIDVTVDEQRLNWFVATPAFFNMRRRRLAEVVAALNSLDEGGTLGRKVIATRYTDGLPDISASSRAALRAQLERFIDPMGDA